MLSPAGWDTETALFRPARIAPELVCLTHADTKGEVGLLHHADGAAWLRANLGKRLLIGQNLAFDTAVMGAYDPSLVAPIFQAYEEDLLTCTMLREKLIDIAKGEFRGHVNRDGSWTPHGYGLDNLSRKYRGAFLTKDEWRMFYGAFRDVPIAQWVEHAETVAPFVHPDRALAHWESLYGEIQPDWIAAAKKLTTEPANPAGVVTYPKEDAVATVEVYLAQTAHEDFLEDQFRQARAAFALHLASCWGVRTDLASVDLLEEQSQREYDKLRKELEKAGLVKKDGTRDTKVAKARMVQVCEEIGKVPVKTKSGDIALDADACEKSEDEILMAYSQFSVYKKVMSTDVELLRKGTMMPIHCSYGLAESGRTTCSRPNLQNLRRL